ncbi:MAG: hypothetical protein Q4E33_03970 [Erysipelotrichaceae bacterium]|nr:hypothetical protein [Erysipelotrichaceae bacterium]
MKYYQDLACLGVFTLEDAGIIMGNIKNASKQLNSMVKAGTVARIKKNLYTCIDLVSGDLLADKYLIASHITESSFVSYHSAFEFYGFYNQVFNEIQVSSNKRFFNFGTETYHYRCYLSNVTKQIDTIKGARVTSIERTIIDSINMLGKVMDVEELIKCLELVHIVSEDKLKEMLVEYDKEILYRKVGYVLSSFKEQFNLSDKFFKFCKEKSDFTYRGRLSSNELNKLVYINEWSLYGYRNLLLLGSKGEFENV